MTRFIRHTEETAPDAAKPLLAQAKGTFGFIPNLYAVMAEAPGLLEAYQRVHDLFASSSLAAEEKTVVWQTINVENACHYCVPAHTAIASSMQVDDAITEALRDGSPLPEARLEALRTFTLQVVRQRGHLSEAEVHAFLEAGYSQRSVLEVILGYSQKIMSNYANHLADTPVDAVFEKFAWSPADKAA